MHSTAKISGRSLPKKHVRLEAQPSVNVRPMSGEKTRVSSPISLSLSLVYVLIYLNQYCTLLNAYLSKSERVLGAGRPLPAGTAASRSITVIEASLVSNVMYENPFRSNPELVDAQLR